MSSHLKTHELQVDREFRALIPPLKPEERSGLEANIIADGCRDPLVFWNHRPRPLILDGHNRHEICRLHHLDFKVIEKEFEDRDEAKTWIIKTQCGRRNLSQSQRAMLAAKLANLSNGQRKAASENSVAQPEASKLFNVSPDLVGFAKRVQDRGVSELAAAVDADEISVSTAAEIATLEPAEQRVVLKAKGKGIIGKAKEIKRARATRRKKDRTARQAKAVAAQHPLNGQKYRLLTGDLSECSSSIISDSIDAIITDPPYPAEFLPVYTKLVELAGRVLKNGGHLLVMIGQANLPDIMQRLCAGPLTYQWTLGYFTPGQSTQCFGRKIKSNWKPVVWLTKGRNNSEHVEDTFRSDANDKRFHKWGQSISGMAQIVEGFTVAKQTVLDPFVGGGATAVASVATDRLFVGIDIDPACIAQTAERLQQL